MTRITNTKKDPCWEADQRVPSVPSQKMYFTGCTVAKPTVGGGNPVQRTCRLTKWNKVVRRSQNILFGWCFISDLSWWNAAAACFVLLAVERQRWSEETESKKYFLKNTPSYAFKRRKKKKHFKSLSCLQIKNRCDLFIFWGETFREPSFAILSSVCRRTSLRNQKLRPVTESRGLNCHKVPLLTRWWITFISVRPLI